MYKLSTRANTMRSKHTNKHKKITRRNPVASQLRTPRFKMQVVVSKLHRATKHKKRLTE